MSCLKKSSIRVPYTQLALSPSIKVSKSLTVRKANIASELSPMTKNLINNGPAILTVKDGVPLGFQSKVHDLTKSGLE